MKLPPAYAAEYQAVLKDLARGSPLRSSAIMLALKKVLSSSNLLTSTHPNACSWQSLAAFTARLCDESRSSVMDLLTCVVYLRRFVEGLPARAVGAPHSCFRLVTVALMVALKFNRDDSLRNDIWCRKLAPLFKLDELHRMERQFVASIQYHLTVSPSDIYLVYILA